MFIQKNECSDLKISVYTGEYVFMTILVGSNMESFKQRAHCINAIRYALDLFTSNCGFLMYKIYSRHDIAKILLKLALSTNQSINVYLWSMLSLKYHHY